MPSHPRSRTGSLIRVVTFAVVGAVAFGGASAATAFAVDAQQSPVASATSTATATATTAVAAPTRSAAPATRAATAVHGWRTATASIGAGSTFRVLVRITGRHRDVRLERRTHGRWTKIDSDRTSSHGAAALSWRAPTTGMHAMLRLHVLASGDHRAAVTASETVVVRAATKPKATARPTASPIASASPSSAEALRAQLFTLVNRARATARTCGGTAYPAAPALHRSTALDTAAVAYALKMGREGFFAHESPDGSTMVSRLKAVGVTGTTERENIAAGQTSAASVMAAWLSSPGHCANLMAKDVTRIGLGHATVPGSPYGQYWVQDFAG